MAFISDNCNTLVGKRNSVVTKSRRKTQVFDIGCVCHLANLCTVAGVKALPVPVEDLLWMCFNISSTGN